MFLSDLIRLLLLLVLGIFQLSRASIIYGLKPDFLFVYLVFLGLDEKRWPRRIFFLALSIVLLKFLPNFTSQSLLFAAGVVLGYLVIDYFPSRLAVSFFLALTLGTFLIDLRIRGFDWLSVVLELGYNLALGLVFLSLTHLYDFKRKKKSFFR
ncbi:MAG TPA: hypothetical protein VMU70_00530 [Candidatus Tyrphobacter sp.]|nr:hypothetical protein [Candidatus Tyrphobacter sp.]